MVEIKTSGVFFTNTYIVSNDETKECIIIDPTMSFKNIAEYIKRNYTPVAILLTHAHIDHMDGIEYFLDLPVYMYKDEVYNFYDSYNSLYEMMGRVNPFSDGMINLYPLFNNQELHLIGKTIKVIHTPGHTNGSCCYLVDNKELFSGDTLFNMTCGRCDFPTGNPARMLESLSMLVNTLPEETIVYPGHNDKTTIGYEKKHNPTIGR